MISIDYNSLRENFYQIDMYKAGTNLEYVGKIYDEKNKVISTLNTGSNPHICFGSLLNAWSINFKLSSRPVKSASFYIAAPTVQNEFSLLYTWMSSSELKEFVSEFAEGVLDKSLNVKISVEKNTMFTPFSCVEIRTSSKIRCIELKLLLFWLRNAIKFPYNYLLADAITLKEKYLPEEELYNLLRVVIFGVKPSRFAGTRRTFYENFSPWGPILDLQKFKEEIYTKKAINYWSDGGIFPVIGPSDINWTTYSKQKLLDEEEFRHSILQELPYLRDDYDYVYNINNLFDIDNRFDTYLKVYNFKKESWK